MGWIPIRYRPSSGDDWPYFSLFYRGPMQTGNRAVSENMFSGSLDCTPIYCTPIYNGCELNNFQEYTRPILNAREMDRMIHLFLFQVLYGNNRNRN